MKIHRCEIKTHLGTRAASERREIKPHPSFTLEEKKAIKPSFVHEFFCVVAASKFIHKP